METILLVMGICAFITGAFVFFTPWKGKEFYIFCIRTLGFVQLFTIYIYWITLLDII